MAIALDTSSNGGSATASSLTWSHTCTGSQRVLFVSCYTGTTTVTGVTYGGVAMTQVGSTQTYGSVNNYLFRLFGPATGSNNIVVSASGSNAIGGTASSYSGVYQGSIDSTNGNTNTTSTSISVATTTVTDNCWLVCGGSTSASVATAGTNTTVRQSDSTGNHSYIGDSNAAQTPAGSKSQAVNCSSGSNAMIVASIAPYDTNPRYWVGGTNTWDLTTKTNWSNSSGGTSGATVPSSVNNAVFDSNSTGTVTIGAADSCASLVCTGFTGTLAGSNTLTISGDMTLASGMTYTYSGSITFNSTTSQTLTFASKTISNTLTFNGVGGSWTMQDAATITGAITVTNGTLATGNFNHSLLSVSNAGTVTLGSGTITLTGTGTVWSNTGTVSASMSTLNITNSSSSSKTFSGGNATYYNLTIISGSSGTYTISGNNTFHNLYHTGSGTGSLTISGSNTLNNLTVDTPPHTIILGAGTTQTMSTAPVVSGTAGNLMTFQSTTPGTQWNFRKTVAGTVNLDYLSLQDSNVQNS